MTVGVLLLAAGQSRRFGADKRLALLENGSTVLRACIDNITQAGLPLCVALPFADAAVRLQETATGVIRCHRSKDGIGATIAEAIQQLPKWDSCLIALGDMPYILPETFNTVAKRAGADRIVAPTYQNKRGHPVAFGSIFYAELALLGGDRGASAVIDAHRDALTELPITDSGIHRDIDIPADLR